MALLTINGLTFTVRDRKILDRLNLELAEQEIPVVPPLVINGATLHTAHGYRYALYPRQGGHWPELNSREEREWMGRFLGRLHAVGATRAFRHRPTIDIDSFGRQSSHYLLEHGFIPSHIEQAYETGATDFVAKPLNWVILAHRVRSMLRASDSFMEVRSQQVRLDEGQQLRREGEMA